MRKKRQKLIQGRCDVLENPGDASRLVLVMFYFTTALSAIARTACGAECYAKSSLEYLFKCYFLRMLLCKLALLIVETAIHFHLAQPHFVGGFGLCEVGVYI